MKIMDYPKERYGVWSGNPKGIKYKATDCAYEVFGKFRFKQCSRAKGHGPKGIFCKQHAKKENIK